MTGNLSRTVLRGAGARESACLPDVTKDEYLIQSKKDHLFPVKRDGLLLFVES